MSTTSNAILPRAAINEAFPRATGSTLKRWWAAYMTWRVERWAIARLSEMSDRQLKDIGVVRSQIEFAVRGKTERDPIVSRYS